MHYVIRPKLLNIGLSSSLETSQKWHGHCINPIKYLWYMVESLFTCNLWTATKILWLNISPEVFHSFVKLILCWVAAPHQVRDGANMIQGNYSMTFGTSAYNICKFTIKRKLKCFYPFLRLKSKSTSLNFNKTQVSDATLCELIIEAINQFFCHQILQLCG